MDLRLVEWLIGEWLIGEQENNAKVKRQKEKMPRLSWINQPIVKLSEAINWLSQRISHLTSHIGHPTSNTQSKI